MLSSWLRPLVDRAHRLWPWLAVLAAGLALVLCAAVGWADYQRLDLLHVTIYESCAMLSLQYHYQDPTRLPYPMDYDFTLSPVSIVMIQIWFQGGPALEFSRSLPTFCPATPRPQLPVGG